MRKALAAVFCLLAILLLSCGDNKKGKIEKIVSEWMGKTIEIPQTATYSLNRDTIVEPTGSAEYKVLVYTDSVGCMSCKLKLGTWKYYMQEADSLFADKLDFMFFFHPKDEKELQFLFRRDKFDHVVHMDREAKLQKLNSLLPEMEFQCFLLDKDNKVLSIGNPTLNPKIWELYKRIVDSENADKKEDRAVTTIAISENELLLNDLAVNKTSDVRFKIKNTGTVPLIISHIDSSCGCAVANWEKKPVNPDEETEVLIKVTPDGKEYLRKTVTVFCNTKEKTHMLTVLGEVNG